MVDALTAVHRRLRPAGVVIDVRPDVSRDARILVAGRVRTTIQRDVDADHTQADDAVGRAVKCGLFAPLSSGVLWYESRFEDLEDLDTYLSGGEHACEDTDGWHARLAPYRGGPLALRRAAKFQVLVRRSSRSA